MCNFCSTFAVDLKNWYLARAVRDRSAKPGTAVRIRQVPQEKALPLHPQTQIKGKWFLG